MRSRILSFLTPLVLFALILGTGLVSAQSPTPNVLVFQHLRSATGNPIIYPTEIEPPTGSAYSNLQEYLLHAWIVRGPHRDFVGDAEILYQDVSAQTMTASTWRDLTLDRDLTDADDNSFLFLRILHGASDNRRTLIQEIAQVSEYRGLEDRGTGATTTDDTITMIAPGGTPDDLADAAAFALWFIGRSTANTLLIGSADSATYTDAQVSIILK